MKVLLTGGTGFIGARLARALLDRGVLTGDTGEEEAIDELVLFDSVEGPGLSKDPPRHARSDWPRASRWIPPLGLR